MTVIVQEPLLEGDEVNQTRIVGDPAESGTLELDGGFDTPDSNAFGHAFRDFEKESDRRAGVQEFYRINHINQTYDYVLSKREQYGKLDKAVMRIWECCELLNEFVDESDPDLDEHNIEHM
eukprot:TRINITY_DN63477_c0_g1_i1.p1 TRINITY_DN63477_c0_g1~~TRINITY_DN63477_c0_g1_i1.p1  ORF type:complete len:121 (-),score=1.91 TRINITY_DN63477_c0_g1_i1:1-363(-)